MTPRRRSVLLWFLAVLLMLGTAVWQRRTGPTYPLRGRIEVGGQSLAFKLPRSQETAAPARAAIPDPGHGVDLHWRRYPTNEAWAVLPMAVREGQRVAELPVQPAAGKVEYRLVFQAPEGPRIFPEGDPVVLRYKDPVSAPLLLGHVAAMFFGVLIGLRTGLRALFGEPELARLAWVTLGLLTVGGLVLGPFVQKQAFGAYWTGWPFGGDLTDNKTLLMWLAWALAAGVVWSFPGRVGRWAAGLATVAMLGVYLVPHSLRGSQLDYGRLEAGADPASAVTTGR